jgi:hypothetical protein
MALCQTNFVLRSGVLPTPLTTKVSMCRIYGGQMGRGTDHSSAVSFSVSIIPRILCIHLHFLANIFRMTSGRSLRMLYEKYIIKKNTLFCPFEGQSILILFQLVSSLS